MNSFDYTRRASVMNRLQPMGSLISVPTLQPIRPVGGIFDGWGPLWDVVTGKEQERGAELTQKLTQVNDQALALGHITQEVHDQAEHAIVNTDDPTQYLDQVEESFVQGGKEGLAAQANYINNALSSVISGTTGFIWSAIPWPIWLGLAGFGAYKLGLLDDLFKRKS